MDIKGFLELKSKIKENQAELNNKKSKMAYFSVYLLNKHLRSSDSEFLTKTSEDGLIFSKIYDILNKDYGVESKISKYLIGYIIKFLMFFYGYNRRIKLNLNSKELTKKELWAQEYYKKSLNGDVVGVHDMNKLRDKVWDFYSKNITTRDSDNDDEMLNYYENMGNVYNKCVDNIIEDHLTHMKNLKNEYMENGTVEPKVKIEKQTILTRFKQRWGRVKFNYAISIIENTKKRLQLIDRKEFDDIFNNYGNLSKVVLGCSCCGGNTNKTLSDIIYDSRRIIRKLK